MIIPIILLFIGLFTLIAFQTRWHVFLLVWERFQRDYFYIYHIQFPDASCFHEILDALASLGLMIDPD